jgi:nucleoside-diphosphate-sugar epimerase
LVGGADTNSLLIKFVEPPLLTQRGLFLELHQTLGHELHPCLLERGLDVGVLDYMGDHSDQVIAVNPEFVADLPKKKVVLLEDTDGGEVLVHLASGLPFEYNVEQPKEQLSIYDF